MCPRIERPSPVFIYYGVRAKEAEALGHTGRKEGRGPEGIGCWVDPQLSLRRLCFHPSSVKWGRGGLGRFRASPEHSLGQTLDGMITPVLIY